MTPAVQCYVPSWSIQQTAADQRHMGNPAHFDKLWASRHSFGLLLQSSIWKHVSVTSLPEHLLPRRCNMTNISAYSFFSGGASTLTGCVCALAAASRVWLSLPAVCCPLCCPVGRPALSTRPPCFQNNSCTDGWHSCSAGSQRPFREKKQ